MKLTSILAAFVFILAVPLVSAQKVETVDGVRVVHNEKGGKWGRKPEVSLEKVRTLGDVDTLDENLAFYMPSVIVPDKSGNLYVVDTGNHRIQKFGPDGEYLATIGRQGQGPGEFYYPAWLDLDEEGNLYVTDPQNNRIQILNPDGTEKKTIRFTESEVGNAFLAKSGNLLMGQPRFRIRMGPGGPGRTGLPKIIKEIDLEGKTLKEFGEIKDYGEDLLNTAANAALITVDGRGQSYLAFTSQNRIDKYAADGRLLWKADRALNYDMGVKVKGKTESAGGMVRVQMPQLNRCANGIAADGKGRIWVVTLDRQLRDDEQVSMGITVSQSAGGGRTVGYKPQGDTDLRETDAYKLEIYDPDGVLLGEIPLDIFVDGIFIYGDRLFLMDSLRGTQFHEFKIKG
jgi:sugar lactone lactonase YvrE